MEVLLDDGTSTVSTPCPIIDRETGRIIAVFHIDAKRVLTMHSDDDGKSWSRPADITNQVAKPEWKFCPDVALWGNGRTGNLRGSGR